MGAYDPRIAQPGQTQINLPNGFAPPPKPAMGQNGFAQQGPQPPMPNPMRQTVPQPGIPQGPMPGQGGPMPPAAKPPNPMLGGADMQQPGQPSMVDRLMSPTALIGMSLMANSGPSLQPINPMKGLGNALSSAADWQRTREADALAQKKARQEQAEKLNKQKTLERVAGYYAEQFGDDPEQVRDLFAAGMGDAYIESRQPKTAVTDDIKEFQYAVKTGAFDGSFDDWMIRRKTSGMPPNVGNIATDHRLIQDPEGGWRQEVIPGSPTAREMEAAEKANSAQSGQAEVATRVVTSAAERAREAAKQRDFGEVGQGLVQYIPWTDSAEVNRQTEVLKSNAKIENLNAMRRASPTGGALGSVTEKESEMLAAKSGALDPSSPTYLRDLDDYELTLLQVIHGPEVGSQIFKRTRQGRDAVSNEIPSLQPGQSTVAPNGVTIKRND